MTALIAAWLLLVAVVGALLLTRPYRYRGRHHLRMRTRVRLHHPIAPRRHHR